MSRFPVHVSVVWDLNAFLDYNPTLLAVHHHLVFVPPAPPVPQPFGASLEQPATMLWPVGFALGANKFTTSVYHHSVWIALEGHDIGRMLFHLSLVPGIDLLMPGHILKSSRKAKFRAGEVKANGKAIACCTIFDVGAMPAPMMICGDLPLPASGTGTAVWLNDVLVGMHWIDVLMGWVDCVVGMVVAALKSVNIVAQADPFGLIKVDPVPDFGALAAAAVGLGGQMWAGYHGDVSYTYSPVSGPAAGLSVSLTHNDDDSRVTAAVEGRLGPPSINAYQR
ncbi:MAG: hypothetical protein K8H88_21740, partial [Sandaracinaceae bacterium]|nr:hypothetical protein [Sandaracinaceae bacterium]